MMLRLLSLVLAVALIPSGYAQSLTGGATKSSSATSTAAASTHTISVGAVSYSVTHSINVMY
jgi:hypothetical protein